MDHSQATTQPSVHEAPAAHQQQTYAVKSETANTHTETSVPKDRSDRVLKTPIWMTVIRAFQFLLALIIVGLAGRLMHDVYLEEFGVAVAFGVLTWVAVAYIVLTEKIRALHVAYHIIAVLVTDGIMIIFWLAGFAAVAAKRAQFRTDVNVSSCFDDGSILDSKTCIYKRSVILFQSGAAMMAAIAGLGALVWLLFIATFVWTLLMFLRGRKDGRFAMNFSSTKGPENHQMETKPVAPSTPQYPATVQPASYQPDMSPIQANQYSPPPAGTYPPQQWQGQQGYGQPGYSQYPPQQQQQYPPQMQPQSTGEGYQTYGSELSASSPPPQQQVSPQQSSPPPQGYTPQPPYPQHQQSYGHMPYHGPETSVPAASASPPPQELYHPPPGQPAYYPPQPPNN